MKDLFKNSRQMHAIIYAALLFFLYWLYGYRAVAAEPWQWADDGLYLRQAEGILHWLSGAQHCWLGSFDATLLSKTPLFALFLAITRIFCIPLRIAEFSLFLTLPFFFRKAIEPLLEINFLEFCILTIFLIGLPVLPLEVSLARSALQMFLSSLCLIAIIGSLLRINYDLKQQAIWIFMSGFGFSLAYLNREESLWLLPTLIVAWAAFFFQQWFLIRNRKACLFFVLFSLLTVITPIFLISLLNYTSYGVFFTTMRRAPQMTRAYKALSSLVPATRMPYIPIRTETRLLAYQISPTFSTLSTYLEGPQSDSIACSEAHHILNDQSGGPREFFASTFEFVLRDAVYANGATTPSAMEGQFKKIAAEVELAIQQKKIKSGLGSIGICTAPMKGDFSKVVRATFLSLYNLYTLMGMEPQLNCYSSGDPKDLYRMEWMTQSALAPTEEFSKIVMKAPFSFVKTYCLRALNLADKFFYIISSLIILLGIISLAKQKEKKESEWLAMFIGLLLLQALLSYSFIMALLHVLGFPMLRYGRSYNAYGFAPLAVLSVYGACFLKKIVRPYIQKQYFVIRNKMNK